MSDLTPGLNEKETKTYKSYMGVLMFGKLPRKKKKKLKRLHRRVVSEIHNRVAIKVLKNMLEEGKL